MYFVLKLIMKNIGMINSKVREIGWIMKGWIKKWMYRNRFWHKCNIYKIRGIDLKMSGILR